MPLKLAEHKAPQEVKKRLAFFAGSNAPEITPIQWILQHVLAKGAGTILFGQPGVSKTAHLAVLCACLCLARAFARIEVQKRYKVLYLDFDGGWNWTGSLFKAAFRGAGLEGLPDNFLYWSPLTDQCQLPNGENSALEQIGELIAETVRSEGVDVVVVDSLGQGMAGDQNNNQEAALALRTGLNAARAAGASVLVVDHSTKASRTSEAVPTPSGAQQKRAWARVTAALEQEGEGDDRLTRWSVDKSNAQHFKPFLTRLQFQNNTSGQLDTLRLELIGEAGVRQGNQLDQLETMLGQVRQKLLDQGGEARRSDFGKGGTVGRALKILTDSGEIEKSRYGYYRLKGNLTTLPTPKHWSDGQVDNEVDQNDLTTLDQEENDGQVTSPLDLPEESELDKLLNKVHKKPEVK
jgi:AAA domain